VIGGKGRRELDPWKIEDVLNTGGGRQGLKTETVRKRIYAGIQKEGIRKARDGVGGGIGVHGEEVGAAKVTFPRRLGQ